MAFLNYKNCSAVVTVGFCLVFFLDCARVYGIDDFHIVEKDSSVEDTQQVDTITPTSSKKVCSKDNWCWFNPFPQGNDILGLWALDSNNVWAVTNVNPNSEMPMLSSLYWNGNQWNLQPLDLPWKSNTSGLPSKYPIDGTSATNVWIGGLGTNSVAHWNGSTWLYEKIPFSTDAATPQNIIGLWVSKSSPNDVWVAGSLGTIFRRQNEEWKAISKQPNSAPTFSFFGFNENDLFLGRGGGEGALIQQNKGEWSSIGSNGQFYRIFGRDKENLWVLSKTQTIYRAHKRQSPWFVLKELDSIALTDLWFEGTDGWILDGSAIAYRISNTTQPENVALPMLVNLVHGIDSNQVWFGGQNGAILQWNGTEKKSISKHLISASISLQAIHGSNPQNVLAVGTNKTVVRWNGVEWLSIMSPPIISDNKDLFSVWAFNENDIWVGGHSKQIFRWDGQKWSLSTNGLDDPNLDWINHLWASSSTDLWLAASRGIWRWNGSQWRLADKLVEAGLDKKSFQSVVGTNSNQVWASYGDDNGAFSNNGIAYWNGTSWSTITTGCPEGRIKMAIRNSNEVWAINFLLDRNTLPRPSMYLWSISKSACTRIAQLPEGIDANSIFGASNDQAWVSGTKGNLFLWNGSQLVTKDIGTSNEIYTLWGTDSRDIWAVGSHGTILRSLSN